MTITQGWLDNIRQVRSPNCDLRPSNEISLLVLHCISLPPQQFGGAYIERLFTNSLSPDEHPYFREIYHLRVSAHLLIDRQGTLTQFVPFHMRAWHAGVSCFQGRECCNDFSIGIELEGTETTPYTDGQYQSLTQVTQTLIEHYPGLSPQTITGHSDIAPQRKTDPGSAFDWVRYLQSLQ
ncbi:MAG: N-acetyl-anhydromuranmyl-L-alanine amidase [Methylothermaceae bacteria B42]|nr:MAG: N-acetyl-anhydromuranmyl-L-alanine amidase [Methylothermaceae bacteria B42]HHJ38649.1 1,6-anhydro-N-acetylmuramyl-L-alanine amidase AmpD [Methylothermaceae bacterium]